MRLVRSFDDCDPLCRHPEHNPPGHIVLPPGQYEHECPKCHEKQMVIIPPSGYLQAKM